MNSSSLWNIWTKYSQTFFLIDELLEFEEQNDVKPNFAVEIEQRNEIETFPVI